MNLRPLGGRICALVFTALALIPAEARAQEPPGPPPPATGNGDAGPEVLELLPIIGRIGAQVGLMGGASWNPYQTGQGVAGAAFIDLPLFQVSGGRVSYEILVGLSHAESDPFFVTDQVALVANLAAGASLNAALAGPPAAPFPVRREVTSRLQLLQVAPFSLKYTLTGLDRFRMRPYFTAGVDILVAISRETPLRDESLLFNGTAPFDAALIGGQIAQAPELAERGMPSGQGSIEAGFHLGTGIELRFSRGLSLNLDYRFTGVQGVEHKLQTASVALGFHW